LAQVVRWPKMRQQISTHTKPALAQPMAACSASAPLRANGFYVMTEIEALHVEACNISDFSLPQEALAFMPDADAKVARFPSGDEERQIHCNIELREDEQDALRRLQRIATERDLQFDPCVAAAASRYLASEDGNIKRALSRMLSTNRWRRIFFRSGPITDGSVDDQLKSGIVYFVGRDSSLRPTLVVRLARMPRAWYEHDTRTMTRLLVFCMEYFLRYMAVPGRVEVINIIVDFQGLGLNRFRSYLGALGEMYSILLRHYPIRVHKFYLCNYPWMFQQMIGILNGMLPHRQSQKMVLSQKCRELQSEFAPHHLERDLGGTRPTLQTFFPFPLQAGPFDAGCLDGPAACSTSGVHEAISVAGFRGRLWDPDLSEEENTQLEYTKAAPDILRRCGLPDQASATALTAASSIVSTRPVFGQGNSEVVADDLADDPHPHLANASASGAASPDPTMEHELAARVLFEADASGEDDDARSHGLLCCMPRPRGALTSQACKASWPSQALRGRPRLQR